MAKYQCDQCGASFPKLSQLLRHRRTENHWKRYMCTECKKTFTRKDNLDRHLSRHNNEKNQHCPECLKVFSRDDALEEHIRKEHGLGKRKRQTDNEEGGNATKRQLLEQKPTEYYTIERISDRKIEKFKTTASYFKLYFKDIEVSGLPDVLKTLKVLFQSVIEQLTESIAEEDLVRVSIDNPQLDFPIVLPFMKRHKLTDERLLSEIQRVLQSYEQFVLDETLGIDLVHVQTPHGKGHKKKPYVDVSKLLKDKGSIIQIKNSDELCCARAIVTAVARIENHPMWNSIRQGRGIQKELAITLHEKAGVPLQKCGIEEIKKFQNVLTKYQLIVLSKEHFNGIIYEGPEGGIPIFLYNHTDHFDVITKITGFLNKSYFCQQCKKGYNTKEKHICNNPCVYCHRLHTNEEDNWTYCTRCNRNFKNDTCFKLHLQKFEGSKSTCEIYFKCKDCSQTVNMTRHKKPHSCGEVYCKTCKEFVSSDHLCYMKPVEDDKNTSGKRKKAQQTTYIFFDFECTQEDQIECEEGYVPDENGKCSKCKKAVCGSFQHQANLCVVHKVCNLCMNNNVTSTSKCERCLNTERVFSGPDTTNQFCKWLFSEENAGATVICHNFKGYDSYPILQYLHDNAILPEVITNGTKFMSIKVPVCNLRFIDSMNFIPMALADMPKAFGEPELVKGYFPHLFNRKENQEKILNHLPDIHYYHPDGMKGDKRTEFLTWYEAHKGDIFDFKKELLLYCRSDVDILRKCCLKFKHLFQDITKNESSAGVEPFEKCITIASACNLVFRTNFLNSESIGIIPPHGYRPQANQSAMAYQWLAYESYSKGIQIRHGRNMGEKEIGPYKVDGYYETDVGQKYVLEFHGCFWHGCQRCFAQSTVNRVSNSTMGELYLRTIEKQRYIEDQGYTFIAMWECDFKKELINNTEMKTFVDALEIVTPLEPRDAFYGGRTEGFKLFEEALCNVEINYYDVTSLYPYINKTGKIPLGHPEIITDNFKDIQEYEGLIKCKILPPRGLYIPVLPAKCNGKLVFSLCRTCAERCQQTLCQHNDIDRAITGTWVIDEVKEAISQGYRILQMYEVWHFTDISQYDPASNSGGLFTEYVNTFLKVKQEASGWPEWCQSEDDKQLYIKRFHEKEGVLLEYKSIQKNPGLRSLAKLMLNSFWGKFGQRTNLTQTIYVSDQKEYFDFMTSDQQIIKNVRFVNDEAVQIDWTYRDDFVDPSARTNVVIAAYTTAQARLKLYSYLKHLGERVLYCDTDSVIFTTKGGETKLPLGDYLGDLTDEVSGNSISHFVSGGPKNYAYKTKDADKKGHTSFCKVKGITLNFKNSLKINYDTVANMVTGKSTNNSVQVADSKICRDITKTALLTRQEKKDYRIVFDKRIIVKEFVTYPYGY